MSLKLQLTGKGALSGSKTFTIPNPISKEDFDTQDVPVFWSAINAAYGSDYTTLTAKYIETTETVVYPAA